jgi:Uncharacterized protein conserved in bacteria
MEIEFQLRQLQLWQAQRPEDSALKSSLPFCVDTLSFNQWLQFVFLERFREMLQAGVRPPEKCDIVPMAEEFFRARAVNGESLIMLLARFEQRLLEN